MRSSVYFRGVTVEPTVFLNTLGIAFSFLSIQNLIVQKACSPDFEPPINFICNNTVHVSEAAALTFARSTLRSVLSAIFVPLIGSWRDVTGRNRLLIVVAQTSEIITTFIYLLSTWNWSLSPWVPTVIDAIIGGLCGENILHLAGTCVITENSTPEDRTVRLQFYVISMLMGAAVGAAVNGFILSPLGYKWFFTIVIALHFTSLILAVIFVKDAKSNMEKNSKLNIVDKLKHIVKARPNSSVIWIMLISSSLAGTFTSAETNLLLYYLQQGFQFSIEEAGIYGALRLSIGVLGSFVMSPIFTKVFKWSDFKIGVVCCGLTIISAVSMTMAKTRAELYSFVLLDVLKFILYSLPKSIISKCVETDELGSFLGLGSILGICLPFVINYFYNKIFSMTSATIPGAFFIISAAGNVILLLSFSISSCLYQHSKDQENHKSKKLEVKTMDIGKWKNFDPETIAT